MQRQAWNTLKALPWPPVLLLSSPPPTFLHLGVGVSCEGSAKISQQPLVAGGLEGQVTQWNIRGNRAAINRKMNNPGSRDQNCNQAMLVTAGETLSFGRVAWVEIQTSRAQAVTVPKTWFFFFRMPPLNVPSDPLFNLFLESHPSLIVDITVPHWPCTCVCFSELAAWGRRSRTSVSICASYQENERPERQSSVTWHQNETAELGKWRRCGGPCERKWRSKMIPNRSKIKEFQKGRDRGEELADGTLDAKAGRGSDCWYFFPRYLNIIIFSLFPEVVKGRFSNAHLSNYFVFKVNIWKPFKLNWKQEGCGKKWKLFLKSRDKNARKKNPEARVVDVTLGWVLKVREQCSIPFQTQPFA